MSQVITFVDYRPPPRYDDLPWVQARVEEAPAAAGPWTLIDTLDLSPPDSDPTKPAARSLTTAMASDDPGLWYRLTFVDYLFAQSQPTEPIQNVEPSGRDYLTIDEVKDARTLQKDYADSEIRRAITTASRVVDLITGRRFYPDPDANQVRYYSSWSSRVVEIDDLVELTALDTDPRGQGAFDRSWTLDVDFHLTPLNAVADGVPFETIVASHKCRWMFPTWVTRGVRVTGQFGWAAVPAGVKTASMILVGRYVLRQRQAPFGIVAIGADVGAIARIAAQDPEVMTALEPVTRTEVMLA